MMHQPPFDGSDDDINPAVPRLGQDGANETYMSK